MDKYELIDKVGEGQYGDVFRGTVRATGEEVAVKRIRVPASRDGLSFAALREIKLLQELHHENIIGLLDAFVFDQNVHIVLDFMESDLKKVIDDRSITLSPGDIKAYLAMTLAGVARLHECNILHRDLKPDQLLLSNTKPLKITDFGLARTACSPDCRYTNTVVTRWYRPPELLFGARTYTGAIDMWSVGCIFAELLRREALFPGNSDIDQLTQIFSVIGSPTAESWPAVADLPAYLEFEHAPPVPLGAIFTAASTDAIRLLQGLLTLDPRARLTAAEALRLPYFTGGPPATAIGALKLPAPKGKKAMKFMRSAAVDPDSGSDEDGNPRPPSKRAREPQTEPDEDESPSKRLRALAVSGDDDGVPRRALNFD